MGAAYRTYRQDAMANSHSSASDMEPNHLGNRKFYTSYYTKK